MASFIARDSPVCVTESLDIESKSNYPKTWESFTGFKNLDGHKVHV